MFCYFFPTSKPVSIRIMIDLGRIITLILFVSLKKLQQRSYLKGEKGECKMFYNSNNKNSSEESSVTIYWKLKMHLLYIWHKKGLVLRASNVQWLQCSHYTVCTEELTGDKDHWNICTTYIMHKARSATLIMIIINLTSSTGGGWGRWEGQTQPAVCSRKT